MFRSKTKTTMIVLLVLVLTLVMAVTPAGAETRKLALWGAEVREGKGGAVFTFRVYGEFKKFSGWVNYSGQHYNLNCHLSRNNSDLLVCRGADRGLNMLAGKNVQVVVNGFSFTTYVTLREQQQEYCYSFYDWIAYEFFDEGGANFSAEDVLWLEWQEWGSECFSTPASVGDLMWWDNPYYGPSEYIFLETGQCGVYNDFGQGFYFNDFDCSM